MLSTQIKTKICIQEQNQSELQHKCEFRRFILRSLSKKKRNRLLKVEDYSWAHLKRVSYLLTIVVCLPRSSHKVVLFAMMKAAMKIHFSQMGCTYVKLQQRVHHLNDINFANSDAIHYIRITPLCFTCFLMKETLSLMHVRARLSAQHMAYYITCFETTHSCYIINEKTFPREK